MSAERHNRIFELFTAACELTGDERRRFLEEHCADDPKLFAEIEALIAKDAAAPSLPRAESDKSKPIDVQRRSPVRIALRQTDVSTPPEIDGYVIREIIGRGGMGEVYRADQERPVRRPVAIKVIQLGMDSKQVLARFEAERQALAMMNHPGIAQVYDAGFTNEGRAFFAMEYVPGVPITAYCDTHRLNTQERLLLVAEVCKALEHAHGKNVIHRDIKPSNILVTVSDDKPAPKIIDFGVAKALNQRLTEQTLFTEHGQLIGTPEYMSPEQAEMTLLDVDRRTDVYSLGVLLYELLVGALPFDPKELRKAAIAEIQRKIREDEPLTPSTRLSKLGELSATVANHRRTQIHALERELRGELDWIAMKALEKNRTRRYATAADFAADIMRHLNHERVLARPASLAYKVSKSIRKHRVRYMALAAILAVVIGAVAYVRLVERINTANAEQVDRINAARVLFDKGYELHRDDKFDAAEAKYLEARRLDPKNPQYICAHALLFRDRYWSEDLNRRDQNLLYESLKLYDQAQRIEPDRWRTLNGKAVLLMHWGRLAEAEELLEQAVALAPDDFQPRSNLVKALSLAGKFHEALKPAREAAVLADKDVTEKDENRDGPWLALGTIQMHLDKMGDAEKSLNKAIELDKEDARNALIMARYCLHMYCLRKGELEEAREWAKKARDSKDDSTKSPLFDRMVALVNVQDGGDVDEAIDSAKRAIAQGDDQVFGLFIQTIAFSQKGDLISARKWYYDAVQALLKRPATDGVQVRFENEMLWIEYPEEQIELQKRAERAIGAGT